MSQWLPQILPPVWAALTHSAQTYLATVVNNTEEGDDPVDSDGEVLGFENLIYSVFEFINALIETSKFRTTVKKAMDDLLYYIILYMQITEDQVRDSSCIGQVEIVYSMNIEKYMVMDQGWWFSN